VRLRDLFARILGAPPSRQVRDAYVTVFQSPAAEIVLADLAEFCRASEATFDPKEDARTHAFREGRREVWLRIQALTKLPSDRVWEISERNKDE